MMDIQEYHGERNISLTPWYLILKRFSRKSSGQICCEYTERTERNLTTPSPNTAVPLCGSGYPDGNLHGLQSCQSAWQWRNAGYHGKRYQMFRPGTVSFPVRDLPSGLPFPSLRFRCGCAPLRFGLPPDGLFFSDKEKMAPFRDLNFTAFVRQYDILDKGA